MSPASEIASPCVGVCALDPSGLVCLGCCRTAGEIARWPAMAPSERSRIIGQLPQRRLRMDDLPTRLEPRKCPQCGTEFGCGANDCGPPCWCASYPPVEPAAGVSCLCPACLAAAARKEG